MKNNIRIFCLLTALLIANAVNAQSPGEQAAKDVIRRFCGDAPIKRITLQLTKEQGCCYEATLKKGKVTVKASTPVSLCRGFYDLTKATEAGIDSWSGRRFDGATFLANDKSIKGSSPFSNHYYMNVVTYGYTTPYWDAERWDEEIDHMALHGIDMPLMLVAQEAIMKRAFLRIGLSDSEIDNYFAGPAHLPWMRMGNISNLEGPLTDNWHRDQIALAHHILDRERALGMNPICPAFAGFVPLAVKRIHPEAEITETSWCSGKFHNWMLSPTSPLFKQLGTLFIEEWQKEFGPCKYYIADTFNELENAPFAPKGTPERRNQLAFYGKSIYESISASAPGAVWVMQGWMLGYQRDFWDKASYEALVSEVPDDKMLILDLAEDYNYTFWKNGNSWDYYDGFMNKLWIYSVIPNMGGKNALTGHLDFYANGGRIDVLNSPNRKNLMGYGMAPEGLESNELLFELIWDAGWSDSKINIDTWLTNYQRCRYGRQLVSNERYRNIYSVFTDHPRFFWQQRPGLTWHGTISNSSAAEAWCDEVDAQHLSLSALERADYAEIAVMKLGRHTENLWRRADSLLTVADTLGASRCAQQAMNLMLDMDSLLTNGFPTRTLNRWISYTSKHGADAAEARAYERDARRIVTVWGPPVDDYSARLWGGLIGDYYLPRWQQWWAFRLAGLNRDEINSRLSAWEEKWVTHATFQHMNP